MDFFLNDLLKNTMSFVVFPDGTEELYVICILTSKTSFRCASDLCFCVFWFPQ